MRKKLSDQELSKRQVRLSMKISQLRRESDKLENTQRQRRNIWAVGKFFRIQNCYSGDVYWPLYKHVRKMKKNGMLEIFAFQHATPDNKLSMCIQDHYNPPDPEHEITSKEFKLALHGFLRTTVKWSKGGGHE